jgi:hypothetical protein
MDSDPAPRINDGGAATVENADSEHRDRIQVGQRVKCCLEGSFNGQRGRVEDIFAGQAKVRLRTCTIMEPLTAFERV